MIRTLRLRISADLLSGVLDADTGREPQFWAGSPAAVALAFFDRTGALLQGDFTDLAAVQMQIKAPGPGGVAPDDLAPPLAVVETTVFNASLTAAQWADGSGSHATAEFSGAQLNRARGRFWFVVVGRRRSSTEPLTLAAGAVRLVGDGYAPDAGDPPPATPLYPAPQDILAGLQAVAAQASALTAETESRETADTALAQSLSEEAEARAAADADLALQITSETQSRQSAVNTLNLALSDLVEASAGHDATLDALAQSIAAETAARQSSEADLASQIAAEAYSRETAGDALAQSIAGETAARQSADTGLATRISALEFAPPVHRGGVNLVGEPGVSSGHGGWASYPVSTEFELIFLVRSSAADKRKRALAAVITSAGEYPMNFGNAYANDGIFASFGDASLVPASAEHLNKWVAVSFGYDSAGWFTSVNGVSINDRGEIPDGATPVTISRMFGGTYGGYGQFGGDIHSCVLFNRALTDSERVAFMCGEWSAAMAKAGKTKADAWANGSGVFNPFIGGFASSGPSSFSAATGTSGAVSGYGFARAGLSGLVGQSIKIDGVVDTLTASIVRMAAYMANGSYASNVAYVGALGAFSVILTATEDFQDVAMSINGEEGKSIGMSNLRVRVLGANGRWEPADCTSLRWLDCSGNGSDIVYGRGVTPTAPQPKQFRFASFYYDLRIPGIVASNGTGPFSFYKDSAGSLIVTPPSYLLPACISTGVPSSSPIGSAQSVRSYFNTNAFTFISETAGTNTRYDYLFNGMISWRE